MAGDEDYIAGKRPYRIYVSKEFSVSDFGGPRPARYISRVLESGEREGFVQLEEELILRTTPSGRQQIKALFYVDDRNIESLTLQRFSTNTDKPHEATRFSLRGEEVNKLLELASLIKTARFTAQDKVRIDQDSLVQFTVTEEAARAIAKANPNLIAEIAERDITERDIIALAYRKHALERFHHMLSDPDFFERERASIGKARDEDVWQAFFEKNSWIFGYGLFYVFTSRLDERKLEQVVAGASLRGAGKRVDALLRTRGVMSSLCFVELKTSKAGLLEREAFRPDAWAVSRDLAGAVAQVQRTVQSAQENIGRRLEPRDKEGNPTGEALYLFQPRSVVVIGRLEEFRTEHGVNEAKFSSFEIFRGNLGAPEVITFDELYERAKFIIEASEYPEDIA
ncbi:MAG: DUF4263 domain-containing protein [Deltaproteobacteria bacterium]|nr:DUF4263 domain-containing protein [Deltaproteobacteria bacterium]